MTTPLRLTFVLWAVILGFIKDVSALSHSESIHHLQDITFADTITSEEASQIPRAKPKSNPELHSASSSRSATDPPDLGGFDMTVNARMLAYAQSAYCNQSDINPAWNCVPCAAPQIRGLKVATMLSLTPDASDPSFVGVTNVQGFVGSLNGPDVSEIVVAFYATGTEDDWKDSSMIKQIQPPDLPGDGLLVHESIYCCTSKLMDTLSTTIIQLLASNPNAQLSFTGHSLGGALAVMASLRLKYSLAQGQGRKWISYTYGQPRLGNPAFSKCYSASGITHFRVVHSTDPVAHLPPKTIAQSWEHTWPEIYQQDIYKSPEESLAICTDAQSIGCSSGHLGISLQDLGVDQVFAAASCASSNSSDSCIQEYMTSKAEVAYVKDVHLNYFNIPLGEAACGGGPHAVKECSKQTACNTCLESSTTSPFYDNCVWCPVSNTCHSKYDAYNNQCFANGSLLSYDDQFFCDNCPTEYPDFPQLDCTWYTQSSPDPTKVDPMNWLGNDFLPSSYSTAAECACSGGGNLLWGSPMAKCISNFTLQAHKSIDPVLKSQMRTTRTSANSSAAILLRQIYQQAYISCQCKGIYGVSMENWMATFMSSISDCGSVVTRVLSSSRCGCGDRKSVV